MGAFAMVGCETSRSSGGPRLGYIILGCIALLLFVMCITVDENQVVFVAPAIIAPLRSKHPNKYVEINTS